MHPEKLSQPLLSLFLGVGFLTASFCLCPQNMARADNWEASIYEDAAPRKLVGVDKKHRTFNFYEKKSPLRLRYSYPCVTGQLQGDKQQVNDLRTPECVYFVEYKIASGLDFREYGGIAFTLNYPNPVDRLRGKTGHGIWIHSKGFGLTPTRGCVAIDLRNIAEIGPLLSPGTPVVLAEELKSISGVDNNSLALLKNLMKDWCKAWESRSEKLFDYYDPEAYSKATENFSIFRQNKERLFKMLTFINIYNREIHALEGPGYWVTWSEQLYRASNLSTEGVRRLYWQKDARGRFRIVGMEWTPRDVGLQADFQKGRLVAQANPAILSDASSEAPSLPRLDMPEQPEPSATSLRPTEPVKEKNEIAAESGKISKALTASVESMVEKLLAFSDPLVPKRQPKADPPEEIIWGIGKTITEPSAQVEEVKKEEVKQPVIRAPSLGTVIPPIPDIKQTKETRMVETNQSLILDEETRGQINKQLQAWNSAIRGRNSNIAELYDQKNYNRLPWRLNVLKGVPLTTILQTHKRDFSQPWLMFVARTPKLEVNGPVLRSETDQMIITPAGKRQGVQTLWWRKDEAGEFKIVASSFKPQALGLEANYLESVSNDISKMLEDWRRAWEAGSIDEYISFYTPDAMQQGKIGAAAIRKQKESLWSRVKPAQVQLSGIRLALDAQGIRADMNQVYQDNAKREDKGIKTLLLRFDGKNWRIRREDWINQISQAKPAVPIRQISGR